MKGPLHIYIHALNICRIHPSLLIPETELYELLAVQRRRLITLASSLKQGPLDSMMQTALLEVSSSSTGNHQTAADMIDSSNRYMATCAYLYMTCSIAVRVLAFSKRLMLAWREEQAYMHTQNKRGYEYHKPKQRS